MVSGVDQTVLKTMRQQAWHRAKGELNAMLCTFWQEQQEFELANEAVQEFINKVESEGLHE